MKNIQWFGDSEELRGKLLKLYEKNPMPIVDFAYSIGINYRTLYRFLVKKDEMQCKIYMRIAKYINENTVH